MIFVALNQTINGGLYGLNKSYVPAIATVLSIVIKIWLNLVLISNPSIGINGSGISSIAAQMLIFIICIVILNKHLKLYFDFKRMILGPLASGALMGVSVYFINQALNGIIGNTISTLISIFLGVIIYVLSIILFKILKKEDILMIPFGTKIYPLLVKFKIYKEEVEVEQTINSELIEETIESESQTEKDVLISINEKNENIDKNKKHYPKHMK